MVVSGYTLDLYCDFVNPAHRRWGNDFPQTYCDEKPSTAWRGARLDGWTFFERKTVARCPKCTRAKITERKPEGDL